jgi:glutathione peroxidase
VIHSRRATASAAGRWMTFDNSTVPQNIPAMKTIVLAALLTVGCTAMTNAAPNLYDIKVKDIESKDTTIGAYKGKVLLIVNVASKCGYTPQYMPLEALYQRFKNIGFEILAFPCNDFGGQEPGTLKEIKEFCTDNYSVTFPLFDKVHAKGAQQHPLYAALTGKESPFPGDIKWNFTKFLVSRDGRILKRFESKVSPDDPEVVKAVEAALKSK